MAHTIRPQKASKSCNKDRISALSDDILLHVLGFLRADEAVRTCLVARRWRHLWKSMRHLRINDKNMRMRGRRRKGWNNYDDIFLNKFMSCLLLLRDPGSAIDEVEIEYDYSKPHRHFKEGYPCVDTWIRHALSCQARALTFKLPERAYFYLSLNAPLVSQYLTRLEISDLGLGSNFLNFSTCLALEELKIKDCLLTSNRILSQSLKHLSINGCSFVPQRRICISVPSLVSLQLIKFRGGTPLLESMPSLETAVVRPDHFTNDNCREGGVAGECCGICSDCSGNDDRNACCVLLRGLSHAKSLELIQADRLMFIFRRDLRWCPTFTKLKTLLLNDWCVQPDLMPLVSMLEHSPILENLTLQLRKRKNLTRALKVEENPGLMEKPAAISGYLKIIKVICEEVDGRVRKVFKFLSTFGIEITIQRTNR